MISFEPSTMVALVACCLCVLNSFLFAYIEKKSRVYHRKHQKQNLKPKKFRASGGVQTSEVEAEKFLSFRFFRYLASFGIKPTL